MTRCRIVGPLLALSAAGLLSIHAQTVTISTTATSTTEPFGPGGSAAYGQTLTVPVNATTLQSFTFTGVTSLTASSFNYNTYVYAYNVGTSMEVGPALYTSGTETVPASGTVPSSISPNITLTAGGTYIVLVTATSQTQTPPNSGSAQANMDVSNNAYAGGAFVYNNNTGSFVNGFTATAFTTPGYESAFTTVFGQPFVLFNTSNLTPNQTAVVGPVNQGLTNGNSTAAFITLTTALGNLSMSALPGALDELSPIEFGRFTSETAFNNATFDVEGRDQYFAGRRTGEHGTFLGGNGGIDSSGLTVNDPAYDSQLATVHSRLLAWNPGPLNGAISDMAQPVLGGMDMKDTKEMQPAPAEYNNPWNFYVRGNGIVAQGFSQADVPHFDDTTESVELGVDYRITPNILVGLTAGYAHSDATLDDFGSTATVDSYSPGFYASYADRGWYANLQGDYIHNAYTQDRNIAFLGQTASSAPQGNEGVADLDGGYDFHRGGFTFGPLAGVQYTDLGIDADINRFGVRAGRPGQLRSSSANSSAAFRAELFLELGQLRSARRKTRCPGPSCRAAWPRRAGAGRKGRPT
jgi:hypothetical protein